MNSVTYPMILEGLLFEAHLLALKVGALHGLRIAYSPEAVRAAPVVYMILAPALENEILLTLAKLLEKDSDRSLHKLIRAAEQQSKSVAWKQPFECGVLDRHAEALDEYSKTTAAISGRRNKSIAHYDAKYFANDAQLDTDFPLALSEVIDLSNAVLTVLSDHSRALTSRMPVTVGEYTCSLIRAMLAKLQAPSQNETLAARDGVADAPRGQSG